jgi:hypothetical protein
MTTFTSEDRVKAEKDPSYYTPEEWSRSVGYGEVPDERNANLQLNLDLDYSRCK